MNKSNHIPQGKSWADITEEEEGKCQVPPLPVDDLSKITYEDFIEKVALFDKKGRLELYHYKECDRDSPQFYKKLRGLIIERLDEEDVEYDKKKPVDMKPVYEFLKDAKHTDKIQVVGMSYANTPEYEVSEVDLFSPFLPKCLDMTDMRMALEGTVIRIFHTEKTGWNLSTHRKIDANRSKWAGPSTFKEIFWACFLEEWKKPNSKIREFCPIETDEKSEDFLDELIDVFTNKLNKNQCYVFLAVNHPDNRIVCKGTPELYHIQTLKRTENGYMEQVEEDIGILAPPVVSLSTIDGLINYVSELDHMKHQGVVVFLPKHQIKIINSNYHKLTKLRANEASVRFRYLQLRQEGDAETIKAFVNLYDEEYHQNRFKTIVEDIKRLAWYLHQFYIFRYIRKQYLVLPQEEFRLLQECHIWHQVNHQKNKVFLEHVQANLDRAPAIPINKMLRRLRDGDTHELAEKIKSSVTPFRRGF
jgi:hypothetical protein